MNLGAVLVWVILLFRTPSYAASCGKRSAKRASSRIVGGTQSLPNKWPWTAAIFKQGRFICGGSIISNRYILSAAHCFVGGGSGPSSYSLLLGAHDLSRSGTKYQVEGITVPASYRQSAHYNDLALVKTAKDIAFNSQVTPVCMPSGNMGKLAGKEAFVVGWGATKEGASTVTIMREVKVPITERNKCDSQYRKLRLSGLPQGINDKQICAGFFSGGKDSCQGDSGGPLMTSTDGGSTWTLIGIVSFGQGCAEKGYPGVYTRVDQFTGWIGTNSRSAKKSPKKG